MTDKSALDKIDEMYEMLSSIQSKLDLVHHHVISLYKLTNNTITPILKSDPIGSEVPYPMSAVVVPQRISLEDASISTKVFGKFYGSNNTPIAGALVKIIDSNNNIIKQLKTNIDGAWDTNLISGDYTVKYVKAGLHASYRMVKVAVGQVEAEVV